MITNVADYPEEDHELRIIEGPPEAIAMLGGQVRLTVAFIYIIIFLGIPSIGVGLVMATARRWDAEAELCPVY